MENQNTNTMKNYQTETALMRAMSNAFPDMYDYQGINEDYGYIASIYRGYEEVETHLEISIINPSLFNVALYTLDGVGIYSETATSIEDVIKQLEK